MYTFNFILLFFLCSCGTPEITNSSGHKQSTISDCTVERAQVNSLRTTLKNIIKDNKKKVNYINNQQIDYEKQVLTAFPTYKDFTKFTATKSTIKVDTKTLSCSEMAQEISNVTTNIDKLKADNQEKDKQIEDQKTYFKDLLEKKHKENLKTNPKATKPVLDITPPPKPTVIEKPTPQKPKAVIAKTTPTSPSGHLGLDNKGNTCFLNSTTQMLFEALAISNIEIADFNDPKYNTDGYNQDSSSQERIKFLESFKKLNIVRNGPSKHSELDKSLNDYFAAYKALNQKINNTEEVGGKENVGGEEKKDRKTGHIGVDQCDALGYLRDVLSFIGYKIETKIKIVFEDKSIKEIAGEFDDILMFDLHQLDTSKTYSIQNLYDIWRKPEEMVGDNQVEDANGKKQDSKKFNLIKHLPRNFFIALKRFGLNENNDDKKITRVITPDKELNVFVNSHMKSSFLKSIVVHSGGTGGGHYYSYVYDEKEKKWFKYDDSSVTEVSEEQVMKDASKNGYLFSYEVLSG